VDPNFITNWNGTGLTSSAARAANVAAGFDLVNLGPIRNSDLDIVTGVPGSAYTSIDGEPVGPHDLILKYTYTGDGNLDGAVTFDDYAAMDSAFFGLIPTLGWATGDINFDNAITFDDYSIVDQTFFFQAAPLTDGEPEASAPGVAAPEAPSIDVAHFTSFRIEPARRVADPPWWGGNSELRIPHSAFAPTPYSPPSTASSDDPRLSTSRRTFSRDLWDTALLDSLT
jgi:hypothetical protein